MVLLASLLAAGVPIQSVMADTNIWQGLNYNLGSLETNINDAANWSLGTVPGPEDSVRFLFYGIDGTMGDLHLLDTDTNFNPHGDFLFAGSYGGATYKQISDLYIDKSLTLNSLKITTYGTGSDNTQSRFRLDTADDDGASITLTGSGEALDVTGTGWDALYTKGDIIFTGESVTFSDSSRGGTISAGTACTMAFANPTGSVYLGSRAGATLPLGNMGLSVYPGQTWTAATNAYVYFLRDGTRSILDSANSNRLDNLGTVHLRVSQTQYGDGSTLTLPGGTYGSLFGSGGGNRTFKITLQDDVSFAGTYPDTTYGLKLSSSGSGGSAAQIITAGYDLSVLNGDLVFSGGAYATASNSAFYIQGSLRNEGSNANIGINGLSNTVVSLTGDLYNQGKSTSGSGLYLSTVNAVGGGTEQRFEVGDDAAQTNIAAASFSIGTLNIGLGTTNAWVTLVNEELNDNPLVLTNDTDQIGEKLTVGTLNVHAGSTLNVNGQVVSVDNALQVAPDAWLDLNTGRRLSYLEKLTTFVGFGNQADVWNTFANRVKDSSHPATAFKAVCSVSDVDTPVAGRGLLAFDGMDDYVLLPADGLGTGTISAFTVECWLRVDSSSGNGGYGYAVHRGKDVNIGTSVYFLGINSVAHYTAGANGQFASGDTGVAFDSAWHHLALTYNGSVQSVYLDGVLKTNATIGAISNQRTSNKIGIGSSPFTATYRPIGGNICEVRVWNYARSAADIAAAKDAQLTGDESGLVGYWPLDDSVGTSVADVSAANENTGTLKNGLGWQGGDALTYWQVIAPAPGTVVTVQ